MKPEDFNFREPVAKSVRVAKRRPVNRPATPVGLFDPGPVRPSLWAWIVLLQAWGVVLGLGLGVVLWKGTREFLRRQPDQLWEASVGAFLVWGLVVLPWFGLAALLRVFQSQERLLWKIEKHLRRTNGEAQDRRAEAVGKRQ